MKYFSTALRRQPTYRSMSQSNRQSQHLSRSRGSGRNTEATELQVQSLARGQKTETETETETNMHPSLYVTINLKKRMSDHVLTDLETVNILLPKPREDNATTDSHDANCGRCEKRIHVEHGEEKDNCVCYAPQCVPLRGCKVANDSLINLS